MTTIRNATLGDLPYLYEICDRTGFNGGDAAPVVGDRTLLGQLFVAPYVVHSPQWCRVVLDDGRPVGYFVSTPDSAAFYDWMERSWLPPVRACYPQATARPLSAFESAIRALLHAPQQAPAQFDDFPAHLHMDLLPGFQRQGIGTALFTGFHEQVRTHAVRGIHIGVADGNPGAMAFYQKQGYARIRTEPWGALFGKSALAEA